MSSKASKKKKGGSKGGSKVKKPSSPALSEGGVSTSPSSTKEESKGSPDFDAGQLFERMIAEGSGNVSRSDFLKLYEKMRDRRDEYHGAKPSDFEAGRLFERYDKDGTGTISKKDFSLLMNDINRNRRFGFGEGIFGTRFPLERRELNLSPTSMLRHRLRDISRRNVTLTPHSRLYETYAQRGYLDDYADRRGGLYGTLRGDYLPPHSLAGTSAALGATEVSSLSHRMAHQIESKIAALAHQHELVQRRMLDIQAACEECEQETLEFFQPMIERIRVYESRCLSSLQRDQDILKDEANILESLLDSVQASSGNYQELLRLSPSVSDVVSRQFKRHFDESAIRPPREALELSEALDERDASASALRAKDQMIWKLLNERKEDKEQVDLAKNESATINERSAREVAKWKQMSNEFLQKLESCEIRLRRSDDEILNQKATLRRVAKLAASEDFDQLKLVIEGWQSEQQRRVAAPRDERKHVPKRHSKTAFEKDEDESPPFRRAGPIDMVGSDADNTSDGGSVSNRHYAARGGGGRVGR